MGFDYSEFKKYAESIKKLQTEWDSFIKKFLLDMALRALRRTKEIQRDKQAVDTGLMMNSWQIGNGKNVLIESEDKETGDVSYTIDKLKSIEATIESVTRKGNDLLITIYNPVEYASYVEYGHLDRSRTKWIEGRYMVTIAIDEIESQIPARFQKAFEKWIKELITS